MYLPESVPKTLGKKTGKAPAVVLPEGEKLSFNAGGGILEY